MCTADEKNAGSPIDRLIGTVWASVQERSNTAKRFRILLDALELPVYESNYEERQPVIEGRSFFVRLRKTVSAISHGRSSLRRTSSPSVLERATRSVRRSQNCNFLDSERVRLCLLHRHQPETVREGSCRACPCRAQASPFGV